MKTPREFLLARHQNAVPKLDAIRRAVVRELTNGETKEQSWAAFLVAWLLGCSEKLCIELIWPCRRIWAGLAVVWMLILAADISLSAHTPAIVKSGSSSDMMMTLKDQQQILAELLTGHSAPHDADRQKSFVPKPHTERIITGILTA